VIWQPFAGSGWHSQHPGIASTYLLFIRMVKQCSRQSSQILQQSTCCISVPSREQHHTHLCCSCQIAFFCTGKPLKNAPSIAYSCLLAKPQQGCSEIAWRVQIISVTLVERWHFFITEVCHNPDNQKSLPLFLWLPEWRLGQQLGPVYVLQYLCLWSWLSHIWLSTSFATSMVSREWMEGNCIECNIVHGLIIAQHNHNPEVWRLFLDPSQLNLKACSAP